MALLTVIGRGVRVRGRVTGDADLTIEGHVEGEVDVTGEVTVETGGLLGASVSARVIVVRGAVRGDLTAGEAVRLEEGARVVGDLRAPRISIAKGALVRGLVQTGGIETTLPRAKTAATAKLAAAKPTPAVAPRRAPTPAPPARPAAVAPPRPAAPATPAGPAAPPPRPAPMPVSRPVAAPPAAVSHAAPKGPPPPVVPALKKGAKAALKKKAT